MSDAPLDRLRDYLLDKTIEFVWANVPFYARHWGLTDRPVLRGQADLAGLPPLDKATAVTHQADLLSGVETFGEPVLSSGTTRAAGETLEMRRAPAELQAEQSYWTMRDGPGDPAVGGTTLVVGNTHHGMGHDEDGPGVVHLPFVGHDNHLHHIVSVLSARDGSGAFVVDELSISVSKLKAVTAWLRRAGIDPAGFGVGRIRTNSDFLLPASRARLAAAWGAGLEETYSLSEFRAGAYACPTCGRLHFDGLPIVPEVVDHRGQVLDDGVGELLLTGLYPYMQAMPLVRYRTGDLVKVERGCPGGERGFTIWGRRSQAALDEDGGVLLAPRPVLAALDAEPLVEREPHEWEQAGLCSAGSVGRPRYALSAVGRTVHLQVALALPPGLYVAEAAQLQRRVETAVRAALPDDAGLTWSWQVPTPRVIVPAESMREG